MTSHRSAHSDICSDAFSVNLPNVLHLYEKQTVRNKWGHKRYNSHRNIQKRLNRQKKQRRIKRKTKEYASFFFVKIMYGRSGSITFAEIFWRINVG